MDRFFKVYSQYIGGGYSAKVGPYSTAILACLCFHMNNTTGDCFPSEKTIAREMGMTRNTVRKYIIQLEEFGIIIKKKKPSRNGREVFHYKLNTPDKWKKIGNNICAPHEQIDDTDVHPEKLHSSPDAISGGREVDPNKKELTRRNNNGNKDLISIEENDQLVEERNKEMDELTGVNPQLREKIMNTYVLKTMGGKSS